MSSSKKIVSGATSRTASDRFPLAIPSGRIVCDATPEEIEVGRCSGTAPGQVDRAMGQHKNEAREPSEVE